MYHLCLYSHLDRCMFGRMASNTTNYDYNVNFFLTSPHNTKIRPITTIDSLNYVCPRPPGVVTRPVQFWKNQNWRFACGVKSRAMPNINCITQRITSNINNNENHQLKHIKYILFNNTVLTTKTQQFQEFTATLKQRILR